MNHEATHIHYRGGDILCLLVDEHLNDKAHDTIRRQAKKNFKGMNVVVIEKMKPVVIRRATTRRRTSLTGWRR